MSKIELSRRGPDGQPVARRRRRVLNFDGDWVASLLGVVIARSPDEARGLEARGVH